VSADARPAESSTASRVLSGCEPLTHVAGSAIGALVLHGFTGSPASMRGVADAMVAADLDVELPRLPGHGTVVDDMLATGWHDWADAVARAHDALAARVERVVIVGQSMGASLGLWAALRRPDTAGIVCINPLTRTRDADMMAMIDELIDDGLAVVPGEGSDIADPTATDVAYDGTPLAPLRSLLVDGVASITDRFGELRMPLRLFTSRQDHVVEPADSDHLAGTWGGPVERTWLERSFHVATRDFDRELVEAESVAFALRVGS
jgi:carboxylesterase